MVIQSRHLFMSVCCWRRFYKTGDFTLLTLSSRRLSLSQGTGNSRAEIRFLNAQYRNEGDVTEVDKDLRAYSGEECDECSIIWCMVASKTIRLSNLDVHRMRADVIKPIKMLAFRTGSVCDVQDGVEMSEEVRA